MARKEKTQADALRFIYQVADYQGWKVNADEQFVKDLATGLTVNYNRYGYFLCPCRDGDGQRSADDDIVCPCKYNEPDQEEYGHCFCGLFLSERFFATGNEPETIPERRPQQDQ